MPSRFSSKSASLIDNFYCKLSERSIDANAGIIVSQISDHLPYFVCYNNISKRKRANTKYVKSKVNKPEAI